ncbi:MAG: FtsK/SpoIIIE domain-containing protein [Propionibacteriaceae bacterium]|nr:FtsK/SpoIIIE domain-containing protein [Propionibacteriaceae bacterium]
MKVKLDVESRDHVWLPVTVTAEGTATIADVAATIEAGMTGVPANLATPVTLQIVTEHGAEVTTLQPRSLLTETPLCSGQRVRVLPDQPTGTGGSSAAIGWLRVISGPGAGHAFPLRAGPQSIGRDQTCDIVLDDGQVSRRHARLTVSGNAVEVTDLSSSNGVIVGDTLVDRATLGPRDVLVVGETRLVVELADTPFTSSGGVASLDFNRSPVVRIPYAGRSFQPPQPPSPPTPNRFPLIAMAAPLVMGVAMFLMTHNPLSIIFVALSPIIAVGTWLDHRYTGKKTSADATAQFDEGMTQLAEDMTKALAEEQTARCAETPSLATLLEAAYGLTPDLWSRRPEDDDFLRLNLGYGTAASRHTVELPSRGQATAGSWKALLALQSDASHAMDVPITACLRDCGDLGLAGPRDWLDPLARNLLAQIAILHSPAELVLCAIASAVSSPRWDWLMWLPHTSSIHSPLTGTHLANSPGAVSTLVSGIEELIADRAAAGEHGMVHQPTVVLLVENDSPIERGRLVALAKAGPAVGVHIVWLAERQDELPTACRTFVAYNLARTSTAGFVDNEQVVDLTRIEPLALQAADHLARRLAPITDAGAPGVDQSDLPRSVSYLTLAGPELAENPDVVVDRWREDGSLKNASTKRANTTLRALIGQGTQGEFVLDLRSQGPHALVGGTTGAGKSEFLQSWILGLASAHSPRRVTFLFVDYKGGAAFADCVQLPHTVGLVTDLTPHLVRRALTSLRAELRYREHLLNQKKAKDLIALERTGDPDCPPSLVIVVDEFAALVKEVPEFVDGVVDVAQRGRSLGLHLILATQRPAGVIKENLRANTNLRIALRVADEADSTDVIGTKLAAEFDPRVPGRGAVRTGPGRIALFQAGYAGGHTSNQPEPTRVDVETLTFGPGQAWEIPPLPQAAPTHAEEGPTDIARITKVICRAAVSQSMEEPRKPWLPDLPSTFDLAELTRQMIAQPSPSAVGQRLVLGMIDDPANQAQHLHSYDPERDGPLAVFGTGGSGKSAVLRTLAVGAAIQAHLSRTEVYGLDFRAAGLAMLSPLPIVGDIIDGSDHERVARLLTKLAGMLDERTPRYAATRTSSLTQYQAATGDTRDPRILLLVDGFPAFREAYETQPGRAQYMSILARLLAEGRSVGVHVALTADRSGAIPSAMAASIQRRLILRQADENAYLGLGVAKDILDADSPPGRGVFAGETNEIQIAVPSGSPSTANQAAAIDAVAAQLVQQRTPLAEPIKRLTNHVTIRELPATTAGRPTIGLEDTTLAPIGFNPQGTFIVSGMPGSGRTTTLRSLAQTLRRWKPDLPMYYFGPKRSIVWRESVWTKAATDPDNMLALITEITPGLQNASENTAGAAIMIEGVTELIGSPADQAITDMIKLARRNGHLIIGETDTAGWSSSWPIVSEIRNSRRGIVLQPDSTDGDSIFRVSFPRVKRADYPPGRGLYVDAGKYWTVQLPIPDETPNR